MANEIQVRRSLNVRVTSGGLVVVDYRSPVSGFSDDMAGAYGPAVGEIIVPTTGIAIDFSASMGSDEPGWLDMHNQDPTNYVTIGILHAYTGKFFPFGELAPGKGWMMFLSRFLGQDFSAAGTGSISDDQLFLVANTAACKVFLGAFPR